MRSVVPIPEKCLDLLRQELSDTLSLAVAEFTKKLVSVNRAAEATLDDQIHEALVAFVSPLVSGRKLVPGDLLKQKGYGQHSTKRNVGLAKSPNVYVYTYHFKGPDGASSKEASFVKLETSSSSSGP